jgi:SAM-dependent methyltransferase
MLEDLGAPTNSRVLDVGSADGIWSREFCKLGYDTCALDCRPDVLVGNPAVRVAGVVQAMPFTDSSFDLIWCANTLMYVDQPLKAISEFWRCAREGGLVAIKEEDSARDVMLCWPEQFDIEVRNAWRSITQRQRLRFGDAFMGRKVVGLMRRAGWDRLDVRTYAMDRYYPFSNLTIEYVTAAFLSYLDLYADFLPRDRLEQLIRYLDSGYDECLWHDPSSHIVMLETVVVGRR